MSARNTKLRRPTGRLAEIVLLFFALAISIASYFAIVVNRTGQLPSSMALHMIILVLFAVATHVAVRIFAPYADPILLPCAIALNGIGLAMIYRLDWAYGSGSSFFVGYKQLLFTLIGVVLMTVTLFFIRDYRRLRSYTYTAMVLALLLLLSPLLPVIGRSINGSRIWIYIGFSIQPSELAKICLAIFFAGYLMVNAQALSQGGRKLFGMRLPRLRDLGPLIIVWLFSIGILVFERDLGTSLLIFGIFVAMLYVATNQVSWLIIGAVLFAPAVFLAAQKFSHVQRRITVWLHALDSSLIEKGDSYQLVQGLFGMSDGGLLGNGWAQGSPSVIPFANSDFIFASLAEELGLIGATGVLLLYLLFVQRGFSTALKINDTFGKLLACGLAFTIAWQVFVVVGGVTRVIPLTGLTMPFIASGGSSLIANWIILAILLGISNQARRPQGGTDSLVNTAELELILDQQARKQAQAHLQQQAAPVPAAPTASVFAAAGGAATKTNASASENTSAVPTPYPHSSFQPYSSLKPTGREG